MTAQDTYDKLSESNFYMLPLQEAQALYAEVIIAAKQEPYLLRYLAKKVQQWEIVNDTEYTS